MRKFGLLISTLFLSLTVYAATNSPYTLGSVIVKALRHNDAIHVNKSALALIYGGQDISRTYIASANESLTKEVDNNIV